MSLPLLVRPGAVVPVGAIAERPDYDYAEGVTLRVYELADGARVTTTVPAATGPGGSVFVTSRNAGVIRIEARDAPGAWHALLVGVHSVASVAGGIQTSHQQGALIQSAGDVLVITLDEASDAVPGDAAEVTPPR
jgi:alpha-D-xyloside xylohydrolase